MKMKIILSFLICFAFISADTYSGDLHFSQQTEIEIDKELSRRILAKYLKPDLADEINRKFISKAQNSGYFQDEEEVQELPICAFLGGILEEILCAYDEISDSTRGEIVDNFVGACEDALG